MDTEERSNILFGRYQAFRIYAEISRLTKDEFSSGQLVRLIGVEGPTLSRELGKLAELGVIRRLSRRGDYLRLADDPFWSAIGLLASHWSA